MKQRIAVLGGGMGSLVSVFELTSLPGWRDRYDITVYQEGWRLGGKGASGRNPDEHERIEEHGLHILFGFYDNAFRVMRECYRELGRHPDAPLSTVEKAFHSGDLIVMYEQHPVTREWLPWPLDVPRNDKVPGEGPVELDPVECVQRILRWTTERVEEWLGLDPIDTAVATRAMINSAEPTSFQTAVKRLISDEGRPSLVEFLGDVLGKAVANLTGGVAEEIKEFLYVDVARKISESQDIDFKAITWLIDRFDEFLWSRKMETDRLRRLRYMIDFALALARGLIVDDLVCEPRDWFKIDDVELRQWLKNHGAHDETLAAPIVKGLYDAAFAQSSAAGTSIHGFLRMALTYKGSIYYRMQAGMGDTIFAPLYEVLRRRGVKFEFFHSVERIENAGAQVHKIHMRRQATPKATYRPLVDVGGLPCWPSFPLYDQLVEGAALQASKEDLEDWWTKWAGVGEKTLEHGKDFDLVVLGISIGAFPYIAKDLCAASPRFDAMVKHVETTQTQAAQLWMTTDLKGLGWFGDPPVVIPYAEPFDTWADMSHLLPLETWPRGTVGHCAYLCSAMEDVEDKLPPRADHEYPKRQMERVKRNTIEWLQKHGGGLWPYAADTHDPRGFNFYFLHDRHDRDGVARVDAQFWRAPLGPSERYVLAAPKTTKHRLRANESGFNNMFMCGDWTLTALSVGCLEAATMGGIQAARAIDNRVPRAAGDWLPESGAPRMLPASNATAIAPSTPRAVTARVLPSYIETDGNQIAAAPIKIGVNVTMFMLDARYDKLRAICDQQLNLPGSPVTYRPLGPFCVLYCSTVDNYPLQNPLGWVPERDFGIWMPVVAGRGRGHTFVPERIATYTPYIWVDNGVALVGGRTVFGFAKQLGAMKLPRTGERGEFTLDTMVIDKFDPGAMARDERLVTVKRRDHGLLGDLRDAWRTGENLVDAFGSKLDLVLAGGPELPVPTWDFAKQLITKLGSGMRMVFLKQFPDAVDGTRACYQSIVEADLPIVTPVAGGRLEGDWEAEIHRYDSHRLVEKLGLSPTRTNGNVATVESLVQGWARFDAVVEKGTIVYEAT
jgi:uncharacterized protein with NAD-binding domain and iron-sulfur cluster